MRAWIRTWRLACIVALCSAVDFDTVRAEQTTSEVYAAECGDGVMQIVAHADDDLLFMSPDLLHDVRDGRCTRTVFVTAGDAGEGPGYWQSREAGARAAYASMAGVSDSWRTDTLTVYGHPVAFVQLEQRPNISLAFLRLPDGCGNGEGCGGRYNSDSLQRLWRGERAIGAVDGSSRYSFDDLVKVLGQLMRSFKPSLVRVQNYHDRLDDGDHPDHHTAAYFASKANDEVGLPLIGYYGYPVVNRPENVGGSDLRAKQSAFFTYASHDARTCSSVSACDSARDESYGKWLRRQYVVHAASLLRIQLSDPLKTHTHF
jgi:LmbE family N-acetylglucosaminyl deacetylase